MLGYRVKSRIISRQEGTGEVRIIHQGATLELPLAITDGIKVSLRDPDVSWEEKCRLQHIAAFITHKDIIKLALFLHFGGMYYRYNSATGMLHIHRLSTRATGIATLLLVLALTGWRTVVG